MIGQTISHYKILDKLGEGGMGVVYRAHDTKLERDVALKFLPPHLSASEADKARFIQEAKAAATLNHPNICTIYSIEEHDSQMFIAMELVDGMLLRDRTSGMSLKQAIETGIQVAEGLAAAHEKGVVHRDIKPENIMIRKDGIAQIMDFGLAKLKGVSRLTKEGSTVGTAGYMSPEQVQGQDADHRSDIFSLGVLLYEMITGQLPFKGVHETAIAYEIVNVDATPMAVVKSDIPPELDAIILECLEKDPKERTQAAGQVAVDLKRYRRESSRQRASRITAARPVYSGSQPAHQGEAVTPAKSGGLSWVATAVSGILMLLIGAGTTFLLLSDSSEAPLIRAAINMPPGVRYDGGLGGGSAISPDGSRIVFSGIDSVSVPQLWVRPLGSDKARPLEGTVGATYPFWSPDGRSIAFFGDGKLKTIDADGGPVLILADAPFGRGGAWSPGGEIVFSPSVNDPNLFAVQTTGGAVRVVTSLDSTENMGPRFPHFLPGGDRFLFGLTELGAGSNTTDIYAGSLEEAGETEILKDAAYAMYASGFLLFYRQGILMAQRFDPEAMTFSGKPVALQGGINGWMPRAKADYSVSQSGILLFSAGQAEQIITDKMVWISPQGQETPVLDFRVFRDIELSPEGTRAAFDELIDQTPTVQVYDIPRRVKSRLTFEPEGGSTPRWSRDGSLIFYNVEIGGSKANIYMKRADGTGERTLIAREDAGTIGYYPNDLSPDERFLLISLQNESGSELGVIDLQSTDHPTPVEKLGIDGKDGRFSPDGKWILYDSDRQVYISSFKGISGKWQVSQRGGAYAYWAGGEVIYYSYSLNRYEYLAVSFASGYPTFGSPAALFPAGAVQNTFLVGVKSRNKPMLGFRPVDAGASSNLSMIINWQRMVEEGD